MSDYTPAPQPTSRRKVLNLVEAIREFQHLPEAEYLSRMSEVAMGNGNPAMAFRFAAEAIEARAKEAKRCRA